jgi:transcriptional regulator with XRE-family HTH domain
LKTKTSRSAESEPPEWARELGAQVRRKRKALSQKELADLAHCGPDFLYDLERGKPTVRLDKLVPVLDMLGLRLKLEPRLKGSSALTGDWISSP